MRITKTFIFLLFVFCSLRAFAQKEVERKQPRILILLDESSSMLDKWEGNTPRFKAAGKIILTLMDSIYRVNDKVEFGLRVFGHQSPSQDHNCFDTRREVMFSGNNYTQMQLRLADIKPLGVTPIAYSLKEAAENDLLNDDQYAYSIILITDGGESCGGDICDVVKTLLNKKIYFKPYIVSLVDYAPLQSEYACLGNYLQVTNEPGIPRIVDSIVNAFRPALILNTAQYKQYLETKVMPPEALQIYNKQVTVQTQQPDPVKTIEVPHIKTDEVTNPVKTVNTKEIKVDKQKADEQKQVTVPPIKTEEPVVHPVEQVAQIRHIYKTTFMFPVVYSMKSVKKVKVPSVIEPKIEIENIPPKGSTVKTEVTPKEAQYSILTEDAKETTMQLYFTDGHGTYYNTTPQIVFTDPKTGKEVKKFFRTVDAGNNPDPITLPAGTYDLSVVGGKTRAHNITIAPSKNNKINIIVHNATLSFYYKGNENRPVTEFNALVTLRERGGKQINQKCTQALEYEPGNYHISINTLPPMELNGDLEMDLEIRVGIPEPGWVQFTNTNKIGRISLYTVLGDRYLKFYTMDVNGFPESQKLKLLPGPYKVHFLKYSGNASLEETVVDFRVEGAETTQLELHQVEIKGK